MVFERTCLGFSFERPWRFVGRSGVEERIEIAGDAPPDAMFIEVRLD